jgi:disulfide bond formation protein DsbB
MIAFSSRGPRFDLSVLVFCAGLVTILAAWGFELIGGYIPCELCLQQRVPYYVALPVALVAILAQMAHTPRHLVRILLLIVAVAFVYNAGLGIYQSGAQWGFWQGPTACTGSGVGIPSEAKDLLAALDKARVVSCTEVTWRLLGLSFAGWNAIISAALALVALVASAVRPAKA